MTLRVRPATAADSPAILNLLAGNAQPGRIHLTFERKPDYFHGALVSSEDPDVYVAEHPRDGSVVGLFNVGHRSLFVNGRKRRVRYAHDLRLDQAFRGGRAIQQMYQTLRDIMRGPEWLQSVILADNSHFIASIGGSRADLPQFLPFGEIETSLLHSRRSHPAPATGLEIRPATAADLPLMQAFLDREGPRKQFFPCYRLREMVDGAAFYRGLKPGNYWLALDRNCVVAMVGVWDQASFKQTRVVDYSAAVALARPFHNLHSALRGGLRLPARGQCFHYLNLHSILVRDNRPELFELLLDALYTHFGRRYDALVCGFFRQDPLLAVLRRYRRHTLESRHFLTTYGPDPRPGLDPDRVPFADVARL